METNSRMVSRRCCMLIVLAISFHQSSGDTGVSASLILRGTPPFQIYYSMRRDNEAAREISKSFTSSRAELILQPDRSGHYVFAFSSISDANYRKVELQGPSIDQIIHPLASADFSESHGPGRSKRIMSTCSGDTVDIHVDLRVSLINTRDLLEQS